MSRRSKIIIAALILLLLLLLLAAAILLFPRGNAPAANTSFVPPPTNTQSGGLNVTAPSFNVNVSTQPSVNAPPAPPPPPDDKASIRTVAKSFAELFGSFSSEGNFQNIVDAEYYMTDTLKAWATPYVADQRAKPKATEFSGTTTRAIFEPTVSAYDKAAGTATVLVKTQKLDSGSTIGSNNVYYQDLTLTFLKVGDTWKVDTFTWGAK